MPVLVIILITFVVAFWLGLSYAETRRRGLRRYLIRTAVTIIAVITSILALVGLIGLISPSIASTLTGGLPTNIQDMLLADVFLRGGAGLWVFTTISGALWWIRRKI